MKKKYSGIIIALLIVLVSNFNLFSKEIKILAIGNSFSVDAVEQYLYEIGIANGDTLVIGNMYIGGASLELHYNNAVNDTPAYTYKKIVKGEEIVVNKLTLAEAIKDENWDYISLQQVSHNSGIYESFYPYISYLKDYVNKVSDNSDFKFAFHMVWSYSRDSGHSGFKKYDNSQIKMYESIVKTAHKVVDELNIPLLIPSGTAVQNGRTSSLGDTFCRDGYHLETTFGRYTAACTWYEAITGKCVVGNTFKPEGVSDYQAFIAQLSAHFAVLNPESVTSIYDCKE